MGSCRCIQSGYNFVVGMFYEYERLYVYYIIVEDCGEED